VGHISPMRKIIRGLKKLKANSFTLVELLVVISIIGLLAGLAVPAIQGGLDKAKQGVDVSNARQLGIIFFSEANENNGMYRVNSDLTNTQAAGNFLTIVRGMFSNGVLTSAKILSGQGVIPANSTNAVTAANIAFGYVPNLSTSDDGQIPLIITKAGSGGGSMSLAQSNIALQDSYPWKKKGLVVYRVGNSAEFLKSGTGGAPAGSVNIGITNSNTVLQP
jgi:prepilin-type N-terminal cleavage/methylation domain-containing protein